MQQLWETVWSFLKTKNRTAMWSSWSYIQTKWRHWLEKYNMCPPVFMTVLFTIAKIWKQSVSTDKWVGCGIYFEILLSHKKDWNSAICNHVHGSRGYYALWSQTEKDKPYDIIYMWNLKHKTVSMRKQKQITGTEIKLEVTSVEKEGGRGKTVRIKRYKLPCIE